MGLEYRSRSSLSDKDLLTYADLLWQSVESGQLDPRADNFSLKAVWHIRKPFNLSLTDGAACVETFEWIYKEQLKQRGCSSFIGVSAGPDTPRLLW